MEAVSFEPAPGAVDWAWAVERISRRETPVKNGLKKARNGDFI
jgi:hypothetical protein